MQSASLQGKAAVITGARRGIGQAIAVALAAAGADIALCDINGSDGLLEKTRAQIESFGVRALALQTDVSRRAEVETMIERAAEAFGTVDILVNCAGVWIPRQTLAECSEDDWDTVIDTNLKGTFLCCRSAARVMMRRQTGCILNLSSEVGLMPGAGAGAYPVSKAGILMLTRQMALELAGHHIRVNALAPGIVKTDFNADFWKKPEAEEKTAAMVPLKRLAEPADIAQAALFLVSDASGYITGEVLSINGGWHPSASL